MNETTWQTPMGRGRQTLTAAEMPGGGARLTIVYAPHLPDQPTPAVDLDAAVRQELAAAVARLHGAMLAGERARLLAGRDDPASRSYRWEADPGDVEGRDRSQLSAHWKMGFDGGSPGGRLIEVMDIFIADRIGHTYSVWLRIGQAGELAAWLACDGAPGG